MTDEQLKALRQRLKSGEYDGTGIMSAWIALDDLIAERKRYAELLAALKKCVAWMEGTHSDSEFDQDAALAEAHAEASNLVFEAERTAGVEGRKP